MKICLRILPCLVLILAQPVSATESSSALLSTYTPRTSHFSVALELASLDGDIGIGVSAITPYLVPETLAFKFSATVFDGRGTQKSLGLSTPASLPVWRMGYHMNLLSWRNKLRVNTGGGLALVGPATVYSDRASLKGYVTAGVEYLDLPVPGVTLFLDVGAMQSTKADKLPGAPDFASGLNGELGLRKYF